MQDQSPAETSWNVDISNGSFLRIQSAETCAVSLSESKEEAVACHLNQNGNLNESLEVEIIQQTPPSKNEEAKISEDSPVSFLDTDMVESSGTWGDFEGFTEVKLDNLSHTPEFLESLNGKQASTNHTDLSNNRFTTSCTQPFSRAAALSRKVLANLPEKVSFNLKGLCLFSFIYGLCGARLWFF